MYVHIGENKIVHSKDIIGVFDLQCLKQSRNNLRIFHLLKSEKNEIKSVVIVNQKNHDDERFSVSSIRTLKDRLEKTEDLFRID